MAEVKRFVAAKAQRPAVVIERVGRHVVDEGQLRAGSDRQVLRVGIGQVAADGETRNTIGGRAAAFVGVEKVDERRSRKVRIHGDSQQPFFERGLQVWHYQQWLRPQIAIDGDFYRAAELIDEQYALIGQQGKCNGVGVKIRHDGRERETLRNRLRLDL